MAATATTASHDRTHGRDLSRPTAALTGLSALAALSLLAGCAVPMGARRATAAKVYEQLHQSALNSRVASADARNVLARHGLVETFEESPEEALLSLHRIAGADTRQDTVFALAELNYLRAAQLGGSLRSSRRARAPDYYLTSAIYAYVFLAGTDGKGGPRGLDRRVRMACELYNRAVAEAFADGTGAGGALHFAAGIRQLAPGAVPVTISAQDPDLAPANVGTYLPADRLMVYGWSVRNRTSGIGAPLVLSCNGEAERHRVRWRPATAVLRVTGDLCDWSQGTMEATLELHAPGDALDFAGDRVPLEVDTTAPIAQALSNKRAWRLGRLEFLTGQELVPTGVYTTESYRPGRIPVVFVHGTMSSPVRWAEMWNTLMADPVLRERYQFWNFVYNSGNPLSVSAGRLRQALQETVTRFDPEGKDPALRQMVIIGHSQGGLLTRMTVTDTGDRLWRIASDQDLDTVPVSEAERAELRRTFCYLPLPCVKRVVFIATPHRGSYRASMLAQNLALRFVALPADVLRSSVALVKLPLRALPGHPQGKALVNSISGMSPNNEFLHAIAEMPFPAGVRVHSIIAIKGDGEPPEGNDGVVTYRSAHLNQADSEFVVRSGHSCQAQPATIEEVRRILMEHLANATP